MLELYNRIQQARQFIESHWQGRPRVGIILGIGVGKIKVVFRAQAAQASLKERYHLAVFETAA